MKYNYLIGGLTVATDIYYPELIVSTAEPQVTLAYGSVPEHLQSDKTDFPFVEANATQYLLKLPRIGRYLVENGNKITIELLEDVNPRDGEKQVLTSVFGALSYQRELIPMHGGVFLHNGKGVLISGLSGHGKSTLLAALHKRGYTLISDDISNVQVINGKAMVHPCYPRLMLWKDTFKHLNINMDKAYKLRSDMEKYYYPIDESSFKTPVELKAMYILTSSDTTDAEPTKGLNKIEQIKRNTFKPWMVHAFEKHKVHFQQLMSLAGLIKVESFENNRHKSIDEVCELFIQKITDDVK